MTFFQDLANGPPLQNNLIPHQLSHYSAKTLEEINSLISIAPGAIVHSNKFAVIISFLDQVRSVLISSSEILTSVLSLGPLLRLESELEALIEVGFQCSESDISFYLNIESIEATVKRFLRIWQIAVDLLFLFNPTSFLDVTLLSSAHAYDVRFILAQTSVRFNDERTAEIAELRQQRPGFLDLSQVHIRRFITRTAFSYFCETDQGQILEIFKPDVSPVAFRDYVAGLREVVHHPNLLGFVDATATLPSAVLLEKFNPIPLSEKLASNDELSPTQLSIILFETASALDFLHTLHVTHRNLSPAAIYLTEDNHVKIGGFYILHPSASADDRLFEPSAYVAPELLIDPTNYNHKADVYSFAMLAWELITKQRPFADMSEPNRSHAIVVHDMRPTIDKTTLFPKFFIQAWTRDPALRPAMGEVLEQVRSQKVIVPSTDSALFDQHLKESSISHRAVLDSVLSASLDSVSRRPGQLSEHDFAILARVAADSQGPPLRDRAIAILRAELSGVPLFSINAVVYLTKACLCFDRYVPELCALINQRKDFPQFCSALFDSVSPSLVLSFFRQLKIPTPDAAVALLAFGARHPPEIASEVGRLVSAAFPDRPLLVEHAHMSVQYLMQALSALQGLPPAVLVERCGLVLRLSDGAPPDARPLIGALVGRIDPMEHDGFDPQCVLFGRLVEWGFSDAVLRFAAHPTYCDRFVRTLFPMISANPVLCLRLALAALRFRETADALPPAPLLRMIYAAVQKKEFELAAQISMRIDFPVSVLQTQVSLPALLAKELEAAAAPADRSAICLTMLPYALHRVWTPRADVAFTVAQLLQTATDQAHVARALTLCTALAQSSDLATAFAEEANVEVAMRFLGEKVPPHFVYVAVRFLMAIAPFLRSSIVNERIIAELVATASRMITHPRIVLVIAQALLLLPAGAAWDAALVRSGAGAIAGLVERACADDPVALQLQKMIATRTAGPSV
jgi:hypothetical protein